MTASFQFLTKGIDTTTCNLFLEINAQGLSYIIMEGNNCRALVVYHFTEGISADTTVEFIHEVIAQQPILKHSFQKIQVIYGYGTSVLVPNQLMNETTNSKLLELVYGDSNESLTRSDFMYRHSLHNIYQVPMVVDEAVSRYFNLAQYSHLFSVMPDLVTNQDNQLFCIFGKNLLKVMLVKAGKLQVIQNFTFVTPDDVAYHLLNICKNFEAPTNETQVRLSGMIDESSALYQELFKYFLLLSFDTLPDQYQYPEEIQEYPAHYFSHLFEIAACV